MYKSGWQCQVQGLPKIYMDHFDYIEDGFFVEAGAHDCYSWSNTWPLAQAGWSGIYFEPNIRLIGKCREMYVSSTKITVVQAAISDYIGETDLFIAGSVSTIKEETADLYAALPSHNVGGISRKIRKNVRVSTLDAEFEKYDVPVGFEVLVIDVEGSERDVLHGFNIEDWQPRMVIIEAHEHHKSKELRAQADEINSYFDEFGYEKIYSDYINNIYVR